MEQQTHHTHHHHHSEQESLKKGLGKNKIKIDTDKVAQVLSIMLFVCPCILFLMAVFTNAAALSRPMEFYIRCFSSLGAILMFGVFFNKYYLSHNVMLSRRFMKSFKTITICLLAASAVKVILSFVFMVSSILRDDLMLFYYLGEIIIWGAVGVFAFAYYQKLANRKK